MNKSFIILTTVFLIFLNHIDLFSKTYKWDKTDEITINLPDDWEQEKNLDLYLNEILKFRHKNYKNFTITLTYKKLINNDSSRNMAHFDSRVLKAINRIPAYEYIYKYRDTLYNSFDKDYFFMRKIYVVFDKKYYSFIFICPAVYFREYQPILTKIIDNFIINKNKKKQS